VKMITSVMYHYVRPVEDSHLRYLTVDDFKKQLDWFEASVGSFLTEDEWDEAKAGKPQSGVLLTFDDGLKDHFDHVLPVLVERGIFGIFFVNTSPLFSNSVLPVHLAHKLLSLGISHEILDFFKLKLPPAIWGEINQGVAGSRYKKQVELDSNIALKKVINYLFSEFDLSEILDSAAREFLKCSIAELSSTWYLSEQEVREIDASGMRIGSHTSTHRLLSKLDRAEIFNELHESKVTLERLLGKTVDEFCYPYGGSNSYNQVVKDTLSSLHYSVAHDVSARRISADDFKNKYELPRFDCNEFPFGKAHSLKN
jgi:peptidoglycan/xylan/chitin deacetylase (PgdA/CDA1 family)